MLMMFECLFGHSALKFLEWKEDLGNKEGIVKAVKKVKRT